MRSVWVFVDPISSKSNIGLDDITYEMAQVEIIREYDTDLTTDGI